LSGATLMLSFFRALSGRNLFSKGAIYP